MKKAIGITVVIVLVLLAALNATLVMPPTALLRPMLVDGVRHSTGLVLEIMGPITLRLYPSLSLRAADIVLSNPALVASRTEGPPLLQARAVEVGTALWPLIYGARNVERVRLIEPRISVAIDKDGRPNWVVQAGTRAVGAGQPMSNTASGSTTSPAATDKPAADTTSPPPGATAAASIASIAITGGAIEFRDARDGLLVTLTVVDGAATGLSPAGFASATLANADVAIVMAGDGGTMTASGLAGNASTLAGDRLAEIALTGKSVRWLHAASQSQLTADQASASARNISLQPVGQSAGNIALSSGNLRWRQEGAGNTAEGRGVSLAATEFAAGRLKTLVLKSSSVTWRSEPARAGASPGGQVSPPSSMPSSVGVEQLAIQLPVVALGEPLDGDFALVWNKEPITGRTRLPPPDQLALDAALGPPIPANLALSSAKGSLEFDGKVMLDAAPGSTPRVTGRTKAATASLESLSRWLGLALPAGVTGAASVDGEIDAKGRRIALTSGRIEHDGAIAKGDLAVDLAGARPLITGKLASDRIDTNRYLGFAVAPQAASRSAAPAVVRTVPTVPVKEALKAYMRAMLDAPLTDGAIVADVSLDELMPRQKRSRSRDATPAEDEWSDVALDLSALRKVDLDLEVAVKSLAVRNFDIAVPRLKAVLRDGDFVLEGQDLETLGGKPGGKPGANLSGKLSGKAAIDVRQSIPHVATSFTASGVDVYDLLQSIGVTALIAGSSNVEANLTANGASQKQLVESLSGAVKARVGEGEIVGYDFSSIMSWLFGDRTYDPRQRTPFTGLDAAVSFDNGVARDSTVALRGNVIGGDADGTIKLPDKEIDYRAHFKLASFFSALSLRIFGDWDKPSVTPDLDVFSRSSGGQISPADMLAGVDLADAELTKLIGQVIERAGSRGLNPAMLDELRRLQARASGARP